MSSGRRKRTTPRKLGTVVDFLKAFTDSVRKIGADAAIYGIVIILAFGSHIRGAESLTTLALSVLFIAGWMATKWINLLIEERRERLEVMRFIRTRGMEILRLRPNAPDQLTFLNEDDHQ